MKSPVDVTYLADTVVLLRYFEALGKVRRAISVVKKRTGSHEDTIREYRITGTGLRVGAPLHNFQGILRGVPTLVQDDQTGCSTANRRDRAARYIVRARADPRATRARCGPWPERSSWTPISRR